MAGSCGNPMFHFEEPPNCFPFAIPSSKAQVFRCPWILSNFLAISPIIVLITAILAGAPSAEQEGSSRGTERDSEHLQTQATNEVLATSVGLSLTGHLI